MNNPQIKTFNPYEYESQEELYLAWKEGYEYELSSQPYLKFQNHQLTVIEPKIIKKVYPNLSLQKAWQDGYDAYLKDIQEIPKGCYCYTYENDQYKKCPYYYKDGEYQNNGACSFLGVTDKDETSSGDLWDQLKECGIKFDDDEDEIYEK